MRSDKTEELKKRWGREKKAQREPPEWLHSIGCEFNSAGSQLSSRPCASRKMIKDAIRSIFKDESEGLPFLRRLPLRLCRSFQFSSFSVIRLWRSLTCYCRWWRARQTEGRARPLVESALVFPRGHSAAVRSVCVCARVSACRAVGWAASVCQIWLPWQYNNNMHSCS